MVPKFCRIAILVDDMATFTQEAGRLLGTTFFRPRMIDELYPDGSFDCQFGEHGLEPLSSGGGDVSFFSGGRLIEVAIDVADADAVRAALAAAGYEPQAISQLPVPGTNEFLFGKDFTGVPWMVCTAGDNEAQLRAQLPDFAELEQAPTPRIGCVTLVLNDIDAVAAELEKFLGLKFVAGDPTGFGTRALVGPHRVRLVQAGPSSLLDGVELPLASIEFMHHDVEAARSRFEAAGYAVRQTRPLASGGNAYYFGPTLQGMPVTLYPVSADAEILGGRRPADIDPQLG